MILPRLSAVILLLLASGPLSLAGNPGNPKSAPGEQSPAVEKNLSPEPATATGVPRPLAQAHAHNDYEHERPLLDALDSGFMGVEADIYLVDGKLLVSHDIKDVKPERTLQALYLKPLAERAALGGGRIYPGAGAVTLLIDIKGDGSETWAALKPVLEEYRGILTEFDGEKLQERAVTAILSGSSPVAELTASRQRLAFLDGRPADLEKNPPATLVPWISSSWTALFKWRGLGEFPADQKKRLMEFTEKAHAQGRKVRFWGVYDEPFAWDLLRRNGVDVLGSDHLPQLRDYLLQAESLPPGKDSTK